MLQNDLYLHHQSSVLFAFKICFDQIFVVDYYYYYYFFEISTEDCSYNQAEFSKYCWFSHDVTKIQTKKLSILITRFYFRDALEQLKTNFHTNFRFKRVLGFGIEDA